MSYRQRVADHYRHRGYEVREAVKVRGQSGNVYAVDMVAQGALGNLVVTFGGLDGVDDADVAQVKRVAKDIGASAVAAAQQWQPDVRRLALREGVAVLDEDLPEPQREADPQATPWPDQRGSPDDVAALHPWPASGLAKDPARTALHSVALDDLLGDGAGAAEGDVPPAGARDVAKEEAAGGGADGATGRPGTGSGGSSPAAQALWGRARGQAKHTAKAPPGPGAPDRFAWLRRDQLTHGGGYEFPDVQPAARQRAPQGPTAAGSVASARVGAQQDTQRRTGGATASPDGGPSGRARPHDGEREAVLADVRRRVEGVAGRAPAVHGPTLSRWRWVAAAVLAGVVAGVVLWALLQFGP